ncbi:hypothetical protein EV363DRAFT_1450746 [Boletus edulis]|nr:hypothetical protein EV363DRAFT_1450746 [Boletus edulis]
MDPPADLMDIDDDLEFVADDFKPQEHKEMDDQISAMFAQANELNAPFILAAIIQQSGERLLKNYGNNKLEKCQALLTNCPRILDMILEGSKNFFDQVKDNPNPTVLLKMDPLCLTDPNVPVI